MNYDNKKGRQIMTNLGWLVILGLRVKQNEKGVRVLGIFVLGEHLFWAEIENLSVCLGPNKAKSLGLFKMIENHVI